MVVTNNTTTQSELELGLRDIQKELHHIQFQSQNHNACLGRIEQHIPCLPQSELPGSSAKVPSLVESSYD